MRPPQLAAALLTIASVAATPAPTLAAGPDVAEATLDNGLRVLVLEDHRSPIVSVQVWYRVGSRNELPGATGLAHFLEHMMFKGTPTHGKGEFSRLVEQNGGQDNAFTTQDVTSYYVDIAADKVDLALGARGGPHAEPPPRSQGDRFRAAGRHGGAAHAHRGRPGRPRVGRDDARWRSRRIRTGGPSSGGWRTSGGSLRRSCARSTTRTTGRTTRSWSWWETSRRRTILAARPSPVRRHRAGTGPAAGGRRRAAPDRRATAGREEAERPAPDREHRLARAELPLRGRAGARPAVDHPVGGTGLAALPEAGLRAPPRARSGRRLLVLLARPEPVLALRDPAARPDPRGARAGAPRRDRAGEDGADPRRGARAGEEPDRGELRLAAGFRALARVGPGPLRAARLLAAARRPTCRWSGASPPAICSGWRAPTSRPTGRTPPSCCRRRPRRRPGSDESARGASSRWCRCSSSGRCPPPASRRRSPIARCCRTARVLLVAPSAPPSPSWSCASTCARARPSIRRMRRASPTSPPSCSTRGTAARTGPRARSRHRVRGREPRGRRGARRQPP